MSPASADVLIVGAGAYGLSTAWWMTQRRPDARILVVDGGEFASGGTGRNLAGFRMQWGLEFNIRLSQESIAIFEEAEARLDYPGGIGLRQHGYLLIAHSEKTLQCFKDAQPIHREFGVPSEILSPEDCLKVAPLLNPEGVVGGSFCHKDGTASPSCGSTHCCARCGAAAPRCVTARPSSGLSARAAGTSPTPPAARFLAPRC